MFQTLNQHRKLLNAVIKDFGGLDILVNNAGIVRDMLMVKMTEADFDVSYQC